MATVSIDTVEARDRRTIRVKFDLDVKQIDPTSADDSLNPANYSFRPVNLPEFTAAFTPTAQSVTIVDTDTVDILVEDDFSYARDYEVEVENVESTVGDPMDPIGRFKEFISADPRKPERNFQLLNQLAAHSVREDDTGDLRRFMSIFQDVQDILLVEKDRFLTILDIDTAPENFVDAILCDLGNPFFFDLDLVGKRKLARILVPIYKQKGTKQGIRNVARFFLGFDVVDIVSVLEDCLILGESELGLDWTLCPSDSFSRFSFSIIVDRVLTQDERDKLTIIVEYMKPAHTHFLKIIEPTDPEFVDHWELDFSALDDTTVLHA